MKGMKFKLQIATTRGQSERLLAMGVRIETADMYWVEDKLYVADEEQGQAFVDYPPEDKTDEFYPAWSLGRLQEIVPGQIEQVGRPNANLDINADGQYWFVTYEELGYDVKHQEMNHDLFDAIIDTIQWLIDKNHLNLEYLKGEEK